MDQPESARHSAAAPSPRAERVEKWLAAHPWRLPGWQVFVLHVIQGKARGPAGKALFWALRLLSLAYGAGLRLNLLPYRLWPGLAARLPARVFSIGNLTVGGTGKTSAAAVLARALARSGERVALVSRGYCGREAGIVSDGSGLKMSAAQAGDEPFLLAHHLPGVAVLVGRDRRATGRIATQALGATALVLDDGSQYWKIQKDVEVILVDALNPFGFGRLLPSGLLREPVSSIKRAGQIWLTHCDLAPQPQVERLEKTVRRLNPDAQILRTIHRPVSLVDMHGRPFPLGTLDGMRVVALSSIGNPEAFERTLALLGARLLPLRFRDHHPYSSQDVALIDRVALSLGRTVVTTEKDAVRLPSKGGLASCLILRVELQHAGGQQFRWPMRER